MAPAERPAGWRAVDALLHLPNERTSLRAMIVSADQRNTVAVRPCEEYEVEARLEELDQGYRECQRDCAEFQRLVALTRARTLP